MRLVSLLASAAVLAAGCRDRKAVAEPPASVPPSSAAPTAAPPDPESEATKLSALAGEPLRALPVGRFRDAVVAVPIGASAPRPVVVAVHGNWDRVEPFCELWRDIARAYGPFVLCPRGLPRVEAGPQGDRWTFGWNGRDLERELDAGLEALRAEYGPYVAEGPVVYAGFSLGAILGADIVQWNPSRYTRAVLVEGGTATWPMHKSRAYARGGGERILFGCGTAACPPETRSARYWLGAAGIQARTSYGGHVAHTCEGVVAEAIAGDWPWLVEGDARWSPLEQPRAMRPR